MKTKTKTAEEQYISALEYRLFSANDYKDKKKEAKWIAVNRRHFGVK